MINSWFLDLKLVGDVSKTIADNNYYDGLKKMPHL